MSDILVASFCKNATISEHIRFEILNTLGADVIFDASFQLAPITVSYYRFILRRARYVHLS